MKYQHELKESIEYVEKNANASFGLWRSVNFHILQILQCKQSRKAIIARLERAAGPKKKGEPVCLTSYRSAAKQLKEDGVISCLI